MLKYLSFFLPVFAFTSLRAQIPGEWHELENNHYENTTQPVVIAESTSLYAWPATSGRVVAELKRGAALKLIAEGYAYDNSENPGLKWYRIAYAGSEAYIPASYVATHSFGRAHDSIVHAVVTDFSLLYNAGAEGFTIYSYRPKDRKITGTLRTNHTRADVITQVEVSNWKNAPVVLHISEINAFCGGGSTDLFMVYTNGKWQELISCSVYGDDGSADVSSSTVWMPVMINDRPALMVNGDTSTAWYSEISHAFPSNITVPRNEIVVKQEVETKSIYNEAGEPEVDESGSYKYITVKDVTTYYRWNGKKLVKIK